MSSDDHSDGTDRERRVTVGHDRSGVLRPRRFPGPVGLSAPPEPPGTRTPADELADRLRARRAARFATGSAFARALSWSQSKVSRIETGAVLPGARDVTRWVAATAAPGEGDDVARELAGLLAAARPTSVGADRQPSDDAPTGRHGSWLDRYTRKVHLDETLSSAIREYATGILPMLTRTSEFVAQWCRQIDPGVDAAPDGARQEFVRRLLCLHTRHRALLYEGGERRPQFVIEETALYRGPGPGAVLVEQLDHVERLLGAPTVDLRIVPLATPVRTPSLTSFALYPQRVLVPTVGGDCWFRDEQDVAVFERAFADLQADAVGGADAAELVAAARSRAAAGPAAPSSDG